MPKGRFKKISGQSLVEILIGIAIGAILIGGAAATIALTLRSNVQNKNIQIATSLAQEILDKTAVFSEANWRNIYDLSKSPTQYYLTASGAAFSVMTGSEAVVVDAINFARYFVVENVSRDSGGSIVTSGGTDDPSTQKIIAYATWTEVGETAEVKLQKYITRSRNLVYRQTDWAAGSGQAGPITTVNNRFDTANAELDYTTTPGSIFVIIP